MKVWAVIVTVAALVAALVDGGTGGAQPAASELTQATVVNVSLYEHGIKLSKRTVPTGTVVFRIVNSGKIKHAFRAGGRTTPLLRPGQRATLTVTFAKAGTVTLVCTVKGHARKGMARRLTVATPALQETAVDVSMFEMGFKLSRSEVPPGTVVFRVVNDGKVPHDFRISGKGTPMLGPGGRATLTVAFPQPGSFTFVCTVEGHAGAGMVGKLIVK